MTTFDLGAFQQQISSQNAALPPIDKWSPDFCGDIDIQIKHDGTWFYMGTPIGRKPLVKLFASVLKREDDSYFLVTPVEKVGIKVEDVPFIITQWQKEDGKLALTTNTDDVLIVSSDNPIQLFADKKTAVYLPYALVRRNLWARLHQNVFYQLAEMGVEKELEGKQHLTLNSGDYCFSLGEL
ncbi:DUF1285 domain-containing protein [uncultured Paraglaciecola sp.]|uniref:DUF1285 domain-containing protein n=1 Tax=uncultured Paraglaciecola sp. TaxID=1765024 RepID=UPI0030DC2637|tara:strand:- start:112727 stop:113272 length:546 start_codon:yes stop_codon:yes gene_type:complete